MESYTIIQYLIYVANELQAKLKEIEDLNEIIITLQNNINYLNEQLRVLNQENYSLYVNLNKLLREKGKQSESIVWKNIVDEMAHSINTDVFAAVYNLRNVPETAEYHNNVKKAIHNVNRIRDIANLIMWDLNKERLPAAKELLQININEIINTQIRTIKDGIDSLRLSIREHKAKLSNLEIPITVNGNCEIEIDDNIEAALELILKDLLRNAFQYTDEENPEIKIELNEYEFFIRVKIFNNRLISDEEVEWFNSNEEDLKEDVKMSKSAKVGLRLVKKWCKNLNIESKFEKDISTNQTIINLKIPKLIKYEKI